MPKPFGNISAVADAGLQSFVRPGVTVRGQPVIGFTQPVAIYERMRMLYANALRLNADIVYVSDPAFIAGWNAWLANYTPLYEKYAGPNSSSTAKALIVFRSDEFSGQVAQLEAQFQSFLVDYNRQLKPDGSAVPQIMPQTDPGGEKGFGLPWWFWVGGTALAVGAGWLVYRKVQEGKAKASYVKKHAPGILEKFLPGFGEEAYGYTQAGRDMSGSARDMVDDFPARKHPATMAIRDDVVSKYRGPNGHY